MLKVRVLTAVVLLPVALLVLLFFPKMHLHLVLG